MDTSRLASHCIDLLRSHNRVSLGNMGSFMAEDTPATLTHDSHVLNPPGRRICFRENETWNDGLLEDAYGSKEELEDLISDVSRKLAREKSVTLDGFGKLRRTREGDIFFVMDKNVSVNPNGFGLVPLSLSPLPSPSKVKCELALPTEPVAEEDPAGQIASPVGRNATATGSETKKSSRWPLVVLIILLVLVLVFILVFIFRDALRPILETILYSPQERLLL